MPVLSLLWITSLCVHVCVIICHCSMYKRASYQLFHHKDRKTENHFFSKSVLIELHYSLSSMCHIYLLSCQILIWSCQKWDEKRLQWFNCAEESINAKQNSGTLPVWSPLLHCLHVGFPVSCVSVWWGKIPHNSLGILLISNLVKEQHNLGDTRAQAEIKLW